MTSSPTSGRAGLWLILALALGAVAFLLIADPLGLLDGARDRDAAESSAGDGLAGRGTDEAQTSGKPLSTVKLEGVYGIGDLGSVRLRVMDAATKRPRKGQSVTLRSRSGTDTVLTAEADGVVQFAKVAPGRGWQVLIAAEGVRAVTLEGVAVKPGVTTDLGDIWLGQNVVLRGRVLSPSGKALPGSSVAVYSPAAVVAGQGLVSFMVGQALAAPSPREQVTTDEEGWFRFTTLGDGTYSLVARHPGFGTRQQNEVVVSARSGSSPLVVRLGEGATMKGKVSDPDGKAVAGARVVALRDAGNNFSFNATLERDEAVSDARGEYVLDTLVDGAGYRFGVLAEGFASAWDSQRTEVQGKLERDFALSRGGYVEGRVTEEGTGNGVADASVTVVIGRMAFGGGGGRGGRTGPGTAPPANTDPTTPAMTRTDAQGKFRLGPLLPGPVMSAVVKAPGYTTYSSTNIGPFSQNPWPEVSLETTLVDVALKRGGTIQGLVKDVEGRPIPGANVLAAPGGQMGMMAMWSGSPAGTTDVQGHFQLDGVPPGDYHLTADAPGFAFAEAGTEATKVTVPETGGSVALDLVLSAAGVITGVVTDGKGEPLAGVRVRTRASMGNLFGGGGGRGGTGGPGAGAGARMVAALRTSADLTDAQGKFRLDGVGTAIEWTVEAEAEDYVTAQSPKLKAGEVQEVKLALTGGATLSGYVVGEGGGRVAGARLRIGTLEGDQLTQPFLSGWQVERTLDARVFVSDEEGRFLITNVRPGRIAVRAEHRDFVTFFKRNLTLTADEVRENYVVTLPRGETVEGLVKGADGRPIENAMVVVTSQGSPTAPAPANAAPAEPGDSVEPSMNARTDRDGRFKVENIPPGTWNVIVAFASGHMGWFGSNDEAAIVREVRVPARDVEFRLKVQEPGANPFGGMRPPGVGPRPAGGGGAGGGGGGTPPR